MYSCSTVQWCFSKEPSIVAGVHYLPSVAGSMQLEHKARERSQPEITIQYLNLINHYVYTIFVLPDLGTGHRMSTELGD